MERGGERQQLLAGIRSILLSTRYFGRFSSGIRLRIASTSSSTPLRASISRQTASASAAPLQAEVTIARSRRRLGAKMPGVSTRTICAAPSMAMPRTSARVVCTLRETIDTLVPTRLLSRVDLPAFGTPIRATKPARVSLGEQPRGGARAARILGLGCGVVVDHSGCSPGSSPVHSPSRTSRSRAAVCSARRFEPPMPMPGATPVTRASMRNCGAWSGPARSTTA